jgi:NAD(P)H dehydrogenase (quinone)
MTAANCRLDRLVLDHLLRRGVAPGDVVAASRDPDSLQLYADRGVEVRYADYADPVARASFGGRSRVVA